MIYSLHGLNQQSHLMDSETIKSVALNLRSSAQDGVTLATLKSTHVEFSERFPKLFNACCDVNFNLDHLDFMLKTMQSMNDNKIDDDAANVVVFDRLKQQYFAPIEEQMKKAEAEKNEVKT